MCTVSMIGDHFQDKWQQPNYQQYFAKPNEVSKADFEALKKEVLEMKELLKRALKYDEANNEPHCEMEDKVKLLKEMAKMVGVDLSEIFKDETPKG